jgi:hypothetical protein
MKYFLIIIFAILPISVNAQTMVVQDPGAYAYLNGLDKKSQEQLEFLQAIQEVDLVIKSALTGNKKMGNGINSSLLAYNDYFILSNNFGSRRGVGLKEAPQAIMKDIDLVFSPKSIKVSPNHNNKIEEAYFNKERWVSDNIKAGLIISEMILNSSKSRIPQITNFGNDIDTTTTLKEAVDFNNRLVLELILEIRNANLLLANMLRSQNSRSYEGNVVADYSKDDLDKFMSSDSVLGRNTSRTVKDSKFTHFAR